jgi:hypothetical protein
MSVMHVGRRKRGKVQLTIHSRIRVFAYLKLYLSGQINRSRRLSPACGSRFGLNVLPDRRRKVRIEGRLEVRTGNLA